MCCNSKNKVFSTWITKYMKSCCPHLDFLDLHQCYIFVTHFQHLIVSEILVPMKLWGWRQIEKEKKRKRREKRKKQHLPVLARRPSLEFSPSPRARGKSSYFSCWNLFAFLGSQASILAALAQGHLSDGANGAPERAWCLQDPLPHLSITFLFFFFSSCYRHRNRQWSNTDKR